MGCTAVTVSLALRDSTEVSEETRRRIQAKAREMNYVPNARARSLRNQRTHVIGVVVSSFMDRIRGDLFSHSVSALQSRGYSALVRQVEGETFGHSECLKDIMGSEVDGAILLAMSGLNRAIADVPTEALARTVLLGNCLINSPELDMVTVDRAQAAELAVERFARMGRCRPVVVCDGFEGSYTREKLRGFRNACGRRNMPFGDETVFAGSCQTAYLMGVRVAEEILALPRLPDAAFVTNGEMTIGFATHLQAAGVRIPEEIAVVGYDRISAATARELGLAMVEQPLAELAEAAAGLVLQKAGGNAVDGELRKIVLPHVLVEYSEAS